MKRFAAPVCVFSLYFVRIFCILVFLCGPARAAPFLCPPRLWQSSLPGMRLRSLCIERSDSVAEHGNACGAGVEHITMVHIYQVNYNKETFAAMNAGYLEFWDGRPLPLRITVGCSALALGSTVEIDVLAKL